MSKIEVDAIDKQSGSTLTLGGSGTAVTLASGATQSGFGRTGTVDWQTGSIKTATFTAANGEGYFINQGSQITANLPAGSAGAIVAFSDYARNFATYNLIISPNGSEKIGGVAQDAKLTVNGQAATFVYVDSTKGWVNVQNAEDTETGIEPYIGATGGNAIVTCGNFKTHIFTSPGTFTVTRAAVCAPDNVVDYLVMAGGGGGAGAAGPGSGGRGGGGAGGGRTFQSTPTTNPLKAPAGITVTATSFPITVGAGGTAGPPSGSGGQGNPTTFSTITSAGGGFGATHPASGGPGGSGGGSYAGDPPGSGNVPPTNPAQGHPSVPFSPTSGGTGGGGFGAAPPGSAPTNAGTAGGAGSYVPTAFIGPTAPSYGETGPAGRYFGGGGGGGGYNAAGGAGGLGGGGNGANSYGPGGAGDPAPSGDANTGGGGGSVGAAPGSGTNGGAGGSGIVMIRYRFQ